MIPSKEDDAKHVLSISDVGVMIVNWQFFFTVNVLTVFFDGSF